MVTSNGSWLMAQGSCLRARGTRPRKFGARARGLGGPSANFFLALSHGPRGMSHEPWAMSHEPLIIDDLSTRPAEGCLLASSHLVIGKVNPVQSRMMRMLFWSPSEPQKTIKSMGQSKTNTRTSSWTYARNLSCPFSYWTVFEPRGSFDLSSFRSVVPLRPHWNPNGHYVQQPGPERRHLARV